MAGPIDNDTTIMHIAARTGGVCARADLVLGGVSKTAIDRRVERGMLRPVGSGVYVVASLEARSTLLHVAVVAEPEGVISHATGGRLGLLAVEPAQPGAPVDLSVPANVQRRIEGVRLHRRRVMPAPHEIVWIDGLPVTNAARTIVDLAATVGPSRLRHIIETAIRDDLLTPNDLSACFAAAARRGLKGTVKLRGLLVELFDDEPIPTSVLEAKLALLLADNDLTGFVPQYVPPWYDGWRGVTDFADAELKIVLEADGRRWHTRSQDFAADRRRDRLAAVHGWLVCRVTWEEVTAQPGAVVDLLRDLVAARSVGRAA